MQLGGGGYDVQHLYAGSLIQPKFEDDGAREGDGEKVENGAMLVTTSRARACEKARAHDRRERLERIHVGVSQRVETRKKNTEERTHEERK